MGTKNSIFLGLIFFSAPLVSYGFGAVEDTASALPIQWTIEGESGDFSPAGWASEEVLALTRVQAVRMGLKINEFVDERFDPVKGKRAALEFYNEQATVAAQEIFQYKGG